MALFQREKNKTWYVDITTPSGKRIKRSTGTVDKKLAQEYHDKLKYEMWREDKLDKKPARIFEEIMILFLRDSDGQKRIDYKKAHASYWASVFGGRDISKIAGDEIFNNIPTHKDTGASLSNATKNRYRSTILRAFSLAYKVGWIQSVPYIPRLKEPTVRVRWITKQEARTLISNLNLGWMRNVCQFALLTGARMSEILSLTWSNVNMKDRFAVVLGENAKSGRARNIPLNDDAFNLLRRLPKNIEYVFDRGTGIRINDIDRRDFNKALKLSGIDNFHFHDLRHTWASWHVQAGTPLFTLKELGGWESLEMVKKYAHLNGEHLSKFSGNVSFMSQNDFEEKTEVIFKLVSA